MVAPRSGRASATALPSKTGAKRSVDTTEMTGSVSRRMLSNIFFGSVLASRPAMKSATTVSSNEWRKANSAPTRMPGRSTGSVHPPEGPQRPRARAHGGALEVRVEALERGA